MPITVIATPNKTIDGILSNVNASRSQLPYKFQREDFISIGIVDDGGGLMAIILEPPTVLADFVVGETIYFQASNGSESFIDTIIAVNPSAANVALVINRPFVSNPDTGFVNKISARPNYKIVVRILDDTGSPGNLLIPLDFRYSPDPTGFLFVDVGQLLTEVIEEESINFVEYELWYLEEWTGFSGVIAGTPRIMAIYAERQQFQLGGSNAYEFLLRNAQVIIALTQLTGYDGFQITVVCDNANQDFPVGTQCYVITDTQQFQGASTFQNAGTVIVAPTVLPQADEVPAVGFISTYSFNKVPVARLLTSFLNPVLWKGWASEISYIKDINFEARIGGVTSRERIQNFDINKTYLNEDFGFDYTDLTPIIRSIDLINGLAFSPQTKFRGVSVGNSIDTARYTELIYFQVKDECKNAIMVDWVNQNGGHSSWLFEINQIITRDVNEGVIAERAINDDYENVNRTKLRLPNRWTQNILLQADGLLLDQLVALQEIKESDFVAVRLNKSGSEVIFVVVVGSSQTVYETNNNNHSFELQIDFPDNYDFFASKLY